MMHIKELCNVIKVEKSQQQQSINDFFQKLEILLNRLDFMLKPLVNVELPMEEDEIDVDEGV
jgi:hypothetical protein